MQFWLHFTLYFFKHIVFVSVSHRTTALITLFSQYLRHIPVPFPTYSKDKKLHTSRIYVFQILPVCITFPVCNLLSEYVHFFSCFGLLEKTTERIYFCIYLQVLLGISLSWLICYILTIYNVLPTDPDQYGYMARTDLKGDVISKAPWFTFPYPGKRLPH